MKSKLVAFLVMLFISCVIYAVDEPITTAPKSTVAASELHAKHDKDKDGRLSKDEAKSVGMTDEQFKKADVNGDGFVDGKEFEVAIVICC